jgi:hypothetical protein
MSARTEKQAVPMYREVALSLYRVDLHGTGWKVESGDFDSAKRMLAEHISVARKERNDERVKMLVGIRGQINKLAA